MMDLLFGTANAAITAPDSLVISSTITSLEGAAGIFLDYFFAVIGIIATVWVIRKIISFVKGLVR